MDLNKRRPEVGDAPVERTIRDGEEKVRDLFAEEEDGGRARVETMLHELKQQGYEPA